MSELSDETRALLARGREGVPLSAGRRHAIRKAVLAQSMAATVVATTTTKKGAAAMGTVAAWPSAAMKVLSVMAVGGAIGAGVVTIVMREGQLAAPTTSTTALPSSATQSSQSSPWSTAGEPPTSNETPATATSTTTPSPKAPGLPALTAVGSAQRTDPSGTLRTTNSTAVAASNQRAGAPPQGRPPSGTAAAPVAHAGEAPPESATLTRSPPSSLAEEARLLNAAHRALATGDGARALRLLDAHATRFPASALEPERSAERVFALCHENQVDAARVAADAFLSLHPAGPLATRVRASCTRSSP